MPTVRVVIEWPDGMPPLPATALARVTVEDVSRSDAPARVIGETVIGELSPTEPAVTEVSVPAVDPRANVVVRAHVSRTGNVTPPVVPGDLLTMQSFPVLTRGSGDSIVVRPQVVGS